MNKIHVLQTNNPSRLWKNNLLQGKLVLSKDTLIGSNTAQHIYITNNEEIKKGDWWFDGTNVRSDFPSSFIMGIDEKIIGNRSSYIYRRRCIKHNRDHVLWLQFSGNV